MKNSLRSMRIAAVLVALVLVVAACSDGSSAQQSAPLAPATAEPSDADGDRTGIEAFQIDGIWVFQHRSEAAMDALHSGTPEIVNGCLVVDATIVVWHIDGIDVAADAIAAVRAGENPRLLVGGGGISVDEGAGPDQIPTIITDLCQTSAVWFGAP